MNQEVSWIIWRDQNLNFGFGPNFNQEEKQVIEEFESFEEAKIAFRFYNSVFILDHQKNSEIAQ